MNKIKIKNRGAATVIYTVPEMNMRREFSPGEIKEISYEELRALSYAPGGEELIRDFLQVMDTEALDEMNIQVEPEYHLSEDQVKELLVNGSIDQFLDTLDFAPESVINLIKAYAVSLPLNDSQKREILKDKIHFDVDGVLKIQKQIAEDESMGEGADSVNASGKTRRVAAPTSAPAVATPKYKIVQ